MYIEKKLIEKKKFDPKENIYLFLTLFEKTNPI